MGRPPKFSRDQLQVAALQIVDEHGLAGLTMRSLAAALGTGPMTLYNHVVDRADLDQLVVDAVMAETRLPRPTGEWRTDLAALSTALWRVMRSHPAAVPLILTRRSTAPAVLDVAEALLGILARGGFAGRELLVVFRSLTALLAGFVQVELTNPLEEVARVRALPAERYPQLRKMAAAAARSAPEREFKDGLRRFIAGLAPEARR